ncbi:hypothetical protein BBK36DRAFT_146201 [Trichoderma citrinoviride]|uniref:Nephrocystin 3-like N-terminal domain-containing protein n=1 Tax=Trichoderma citrinoviride TaxID=58853 RepID=A0A2T4B182_9HYPO|nr:hypothetical protein BBK36DRAFT_146201 [Trichoderma citrinoviride]PTB63085.1 hypothetical protein BBK36DRAFT_146201 [Trichoderma citrinoviride]
MPFFSQRSHRQAENGAQTLKPVPAQASTRRKLFDVFSRPKSPAPPVPVSQARIHSSNKEESKPSIPPKPIAEPINSHGEANEPLEPIHASNNNQPGQSGSSETTTESQDEAYIESSDVSESAYRKAWSSLTEEQKEQLTEDGIRKLFDQLRDADQTHQDQSLLRKGLKVVSPYLDRLRITIDFISPFASMNPAAGTALGLIKGVNSIVIAICGAADNVSNQIGSFLERIPAIERCSEIVNGNSQLPDIHNALVNVYQDLLQFYLKTIIMFKKSAFVIRLALDWLKSDLSGIISSFTTHADLLSKLLEAETFASVQEIKDEQVEALIRDTLDIHRENEIAYHNELKRRADEACSWITRNDQFSYWRLNSRDSSLLALFGDMGCGKTITTAYVVDTLSQGQLVCSYYCKDDHETTKLGNIYRSLIWQLLKRRPDLKARFYSWYKKAESRSQVNPTQSDEMLREFLLDALSSSKQCIFIVLDGLDECEGYSQGQILSLFRELLEREARLKVFLSSRYDDDVEKALPAGASRIELVVGFSQDRDRIIANYLASQLNIPEQTREKVVDELAERADGSAIWLRISLEYIGKLRIQNEKGLETALKRLPSSKGLAELYWTLFEKVCSGLPENEEYFRRALETLAVARRPLSSDELAYAVFIEMDDDGPATMAELEETAHSVNLLDLIRPLISTITVQDEKHAQLRLVHQSLKELILQAPPSSWSLVGKPGWKNQAGQRKGELNGQLLQRCIQYLLFNECGEVDLYSAITDGSDDAELFAIGGIFDDDEAPEELPQEFDPFELGLGRFFTYAADSWTTHFPEASQDLWPSATDFIILCSKGSQRLENWVEQWKRPRNTLRTEFNFPEVTTHLDPLVVAAIFGPAAYMADLLKCDLQSPDFLPDSVWVAVEQLIKRDSISAIEQLLKDKSLGSILCCTAFFYEVVLGWTNEDRIKGNAAKEWEDIFGYLITALREDLLEDGNEILCQAARNGCLVLVKKLFEVSERDPELRRAIIVGDRSKMSDWRGGLSTHQSIGEAAYEGHVEIVRFLCQQSGIEPHLRHVNQHGHTVFHQAARRGIREILMILIQCWPEGVNLRNNLNDAPLGNFIFHRITGDVEAVGTVKAMLSTGKVDATGLSDDPGYSPLCTAIRKGEVAMCRTLIVDGSADMSCAVGVDERGKPFLTKDVKTQETLSAQEMMLKQLCSLLPLAVSTEHIFQTSRMIANGLQRSDQTM